MASHRSGRVAEEIKRVLSDIIRDDINDPRLKGFVSVTQVVVSRDISAATIYLSCLGDSRDMENTLKAAKQAGGFIRAELAGRLKLRAIPELVFKADLSIQTGARINALLRQQVYTTDPDSPDDNSYDDVEDDVEDDA